MPERQRRPYTVDPFEYVTIKVDPDIIKSHPEFVETLNTVNRLFIEKKGMRIEELRRLRLLFVADVLTGIISFPLFTDIQEGYNEFLTDIGAHREPIPEETLGRFYAVEHDGVSEVRYPDVTILLVHLIYTLDLDKKK